MTTYEQRLQDIETHVSDGFITRDEADRKIADLKAMKAYGDRANDYQIAE